MATAALVKTEPDTPPTEPSDGLALMFERLAANPQVDVEKLQRLIDMQERILAHNAKAAFDSAFAAMQAEIPVIAEKGVTNNGTYARLEDIVRAIRPVLTKHGFAVSFRTDWPDKRTVKVIGILTHRDGHSRESAFLADADSSGNKNAIQALGSAVSYGRRYTLRDLLNIASTDDDDGATSTPPVARPTNGHGPEGFDAWWFDMQACADEGWPKLSAAWNRSPEGFRKHLVSTNNRGWQALKTKAQSVQK